jgi:hypothetical protein
MNYSLVKLVNQTINVLVKLERLLDKELAKKR